jgi:hypothetical protein
MSEPESRIRSLLIVYFPMFIATLSLVTSIFNGYLNSKFVDLVRENVGRVEYLKTCKEVIDAYFDVKLRTRLVTAQSARSGEEAAQAASRFAALGTYLANLRDEGTRARYTELSDMLTRIVAEAPRLAVEERSALFAPADHIFAEMNEDCVRRAKGAPI